MPRCKVWGRDIDDITLCMRAGTPGGRTRSAGGRWVGEDRDRYEIRI